MASTRQIKSRIRSVKSNKQITKAMELVAASKLRKAQEAAVSSRDFAQTSREILGTIARLTNVEKHVLYLQRPVTTRVVVVITSDRGLAGAYNANVLKLLTAQIRADNEAKITTKVIAVGKKAAQFAGRLADVETIGVYNAGDHVTPDDVRTILVTFNALFRRAETDSVDVITTRFVNSFTQSAHQFNLLPAGTTEFAEDAATETVTNDLSSALFEPRPGVVLDYITERLLEARLYQAMQDAMASEHAMRRVAMKNASDNATDIVDALTLEMNKVRQGAITQELSEISAGVEAMK